MLFRSIGAVLGQKVDKHFRVIYYTSKTLNDAQVNYTTTEKQLLAVLFALDKFRSYLKGYNYFIPFEVRSKLIQSKNDSEKLFFGSSVINLSIIESFASIINYSKVFTLKEMST